MTDRTSPRASSLRTREAIAFLALWVPYLALVRRFWFVADDAYISFRYSRNWGSGLGLVYNPGEDPPAEGYSNFLMVAAGAVVEWLGLDMQFWLPLLCAACGSVLLFLVYRTLLSRFEVALLPAWLATAFLASSPPFAVWSTSGLEAMPYALLFFATVERLCLRAGGPAALAAGLLACLLAMTRVEGIAWAALVFPLLALVGRFLRSDDEQGRTAVLRALGVYLAVLAVGYGTYFALRWNYFGHAWPMTVYAKVGFTGERAARGVDYVTVLALTCPALFVLLPGILSGLRRGRAALALPLVLLPPGIVLYTVLVGGDWMTFGRFLLPALPFVAVLAGLLLEDARRALGLAASGLMGAGIVALSALPSFDVHLVPQTTRERFHFRLNTKDYRNEYAQWEFQRWNGIRWSVKGQALAALETPSASIVMGAIGAASYVSDLFTLDRHGFVTPEVALRELDASESELRSPGHDKVVEERWFVGRGYAPTYLRAKLHDASSRGEMLDLFAKSVNRLRRTGLADRYVADFAALSDGTDANGKRWFLFSWKAIPPGTSEADAWADLEARAEAFRERDEIRTLDVAPPDASQVPGLPSWF